jgi:hypothetical protein
MKRPQCGGATEAVPGSAVSGRTRHAGLIRVAAICSDIGIAALNEVLFWLSAARKRTLTVSQPAPWLSSVMRSPVALPPLLQQAWRKTVQDYRASIEKLRKEAAEAALIRDLATDQAKRDMYDRLHRRLNGLADEVEQAIKSGAAK